MYTYTKATEETIEKIEVSDSVVRGTMVSTKGDTINLNDVEYTLVTKDDKDYYVLSSSLVDNENGIVLEKSKFVRTSVTVYKNEVDSKIESFIKKGNKLKKSVS